MNTKELEICLEKIVQTDNYYFAVFANNTLPFHVSRPALIVINEDPDYMPGSHWVSVYIDEYGFAYFFDSFGRTPRKNISSFIKRNAKIWNYNYRQIQDTSSNLCGPYCLLFLLNYALNNSVDNFLNLFGNDYKYNDLLCKKMFKRYFCKK